MRRLAVIGSGDLGQLIAYHARVDQGLDVVGFFDDLDARTQTPGGKLLGRIDACLQAHERGEFECIALGIGYRHPKLRASLFADLTRVVPAATLVHSSCFVDPSVRLGPGVVVLPGCVLDKGVVVEDNVLLNTGCCVAHDSRIGRHSFLGPRVALAGFVTVGASCFLGVNSTVIDRINVCAEVQTGGGAVVIEDITTPGLYVGVPARRIR
jgi:sugar O-acyltransferase (sialic acid O-acetyltransferase NeuD family)